MRPTLLAALALAVALAGAARAQDEVQRLVTVTGSAEVEAVPDLATITAGVETQAADRAPRRSAANTEAMAAVFAALDAAGIARAGPADQPAQPQPGLRALPRRGAGAAAGRRLPGEQHGDGAGARGRQARRGDRRADLGGREPALRRRLRGAGAAGEPRRRAREEAVADARAKAELFARAAGVTLGPVRSIRESAGMGGPEPLRARAMAEAAPVAEGTVTLTADVEVVFAIE